MHKNKKERMKEIINKIHVGNSVDFMIKNIPDNVVDLIITSPPYDDLRIYDGYEFDYKKMSPELYRVLKKGGVLVWIVGDRIKNGNKSLTSFRQAIYFQEIGFNVHDVMTNFIKKELLKVR